VEVHPTQPGETTYTLRVFTANPDAEPIMQSVTLTVKPPAPRIDAFQVDKTDVQQGDLVNITWKTSENLERTLVINDGSHVIRTRLEPAAGSILHGPAGATKYTLEVRNIGDGDDQAVRITREVTVRPRAPEPASPKPDTAVPSPDAALTQGGAGTVGAEAVRQ
jgi:hypothetical protein